MNKQDVSHLWIWGPPLFFLILMAAVFFSGTNISLFRLLNNLSSLTGERIWAFLTLFGDGLVCVVLLFPWIRKNPKNILAVVAAVIISSVLTHFLKRVIDLSRPPQVFDAEEIKLIGPFLGKYSFPSGHSAMAFILAGVYSFTTKIPWRRFLAIILASLVAVSRAVVGVHWPLDILAGAIIGWSLIWLSMTFADRVSWGWKGIGQKILGALLFLCCLFLLVVDYTGYEIVVLEQRVVAVLILVLGGYEYLRIYGIDLLKSVSHKKD